MLSSNATLIGIIINPGFWHSRRSDQATRYYDPSMIAAEAAPFQGRTGLNGLTTTLS